MSAERITKGEVEAVIARLPADDANLLRAYLQQLEGTIKALEDLLDHD